ncbi:MAG TPA: hypothetical protein PK867_01020 [Pirellulales bacterium]|nr:hypothetical protein [Pirellulales bacterium]
MAKAFSWDDHASVWNIFEQMKIRLPPVCWRNHGLLLCVKYPRQGSNL